MCNCRQCRFYRLFAVLPSGIPVPLTLFQFCFLYNVHIGCYEIFPQRIKFFSKPLDSHLTL